MAWEEVCKGKKFGGLGLGFLEWKNQAMLLKWIWRCSREPQALWRRIFVNKYGLSDRFVLPMWEDWVFRRGSLVVADILSVYRGGSLVAKKFREGLAVLVGTGEGVRFWDDSWCGEEALRSQFPRVFALALCKSGDVSELGVVREGSWHWSIPYRREFFDWKQEQFDRFMASLQRIIPAVGNDRIIWKGDRVGNYSVKGVCAAVEARWFEYVVVHA